jgi:catechol 2,3-dioxygenase-like lactoylglutathione lyase family enzyme
VAPDLQLPRLDHVAIHVADREAFAQELVDRFDMHVIEQTDRFTLVGADAAHGKITLLDKVDQDGPDPASNRIVSFVLAEGAGSTTQPPVTLPGGLVVTFAGIDDLGPEWSDTPRHALVGLAVRTVDPPLAAATLEAQHDMHVGMVGRDHAVIEVGDRSPDGRISLSRETWNHATEPSMLDHIGIRVPDAARWRELATERELEVVKWVDAPHSRAVFVNGPDELLIEYVELTAPLEGS